MGLAASGAPHCGGGGLGEKRKVSSQFEFLYHACTSISAVQNTDGLNIAIHWRQHEGFRFQYGVCLLTVKCAYTRLKEHFFNWTKQDKTCKFSRKSSLETEEKQQQLIQYILCQLDTRRLAEGKRHETDSSRTSLKICTFCPLSSD